MAYDEAMKAKNQTESANTMLTEMLNRITNFLGTKGATPEQVKKVNVCVTICSLSLTYMYF